MRSDARSGQKLTVAHFMPWSGIGGVEVATLRMADASRDHFRHVAFCLHDAAALRKSFEKAGIETIAYFPPEPSLLHARQFIKASLIVARQIRQAKPDIVHFADEKAAYHNSLAAFLARSRTVCHIRTTIPYFNLRQRLCLLPVHSFVFVSKEAKRSFALSLPDNKARVIYDWAEVSNADMTESNAVVRRELGVPDGCVLVGMVARVAPVKDYFTLASAANEVLRRYPNTRFVIVGDNSLVELNRQHYREVVQELNTLGIADKFIFTGHRSDVSRLISAMDISVLCSHREGFGLCLVESMAMGKPVVATSVGGTPEIVTENITGYLHQHGNSKELADALLRLIDNPEDARRMGALAREHVLQNFSRQRFADEIAKAYLDVMRG
ncbi:MAG: glycosyltransferase [Acidobacteriaceae bacterium]